jgi:hypothetical protein
MTSIHATAFAVVVALAPALAGATVSAEQAAPLPSIALRGISDIATLPAYFESANMRTPARTVSRRQTRADAQLQRTKLKTDRKSKLIIIGVAAAAVAIYIVYTINHIWD